MVLRMKDILNVHVVQIINIVVGQIGGSFMYAAQNSGGAGGGCSFVWDFSNSELLIG